MPFPELTDRLFKLVGIKNSDEPAYSLPQDRSLNPEERALIEWLLRHGEPNAQDFLPQLEAAHVYCKCSCGCPTINIRIPETLAAARASTNKLADFIGKIEGNLVGGMLTQADGRLSGLEIYAFGDIPEPFGLPDPSTLYKFEERLAHI